MRKYLLLLSLLFLFACEKEDIPQMQHVSVPEPFKVSDYQLNLNAEKDVVIIIDSREMFWQVFSEYDK